MFMWRREEQEVGSYCLEDKNSCLFFPTSVSLIHYQLNPVLCLRLALTPAISV